MNDAMNNMKAHYFLFFLKNILPSMNLYHNFTISALLFAFAKLSFEVKPFQHKATENPVVEPLQAFLLFSRHVLPLPQLE